MTLKKSWFFLIQLSTWKHLLKYYLIKHRYNDVENFLVNENKKFGMEDRWKLMKKNLKEVCAEYGYISTTLRDDL